MKLQDQVCAKGIGKAKDEKRETRQTSARIPNLQNVPTWMELKREGERKRREEKMAGEATPGGSSVGGALRKARLIDCRRS